MDNRSEQSKLNAFPCFMPGEDCIATIIDWINKAQDSIIVQAYSFSSNRIADALIDARGRGRSVKVLIDKDARRKKGNLIQKLFNKEIEIEVDQQTGKAHNKVMIIDDEYVITGSYNWTDTEYDHNSDIIVFIRDTCVNKKYRENYDYILQMNRRPDAFGQSHSYLLYPRIGCCQFPLVHFRCHDNRFKVTETKNQKKKSKEFVSVDVCFPRFNNQDCIRLIIDHIANAKESIFIQACSLTHGGISNALITAHKRNVNVHLLVDKKAFDDTGEKVTTIINSDIEVRRATMSHPGIAHSKTIIIDDDLVLTGSFNLSYSAQNVNRENLLHMRNKYVNKMFKDNFYIRWNRAEKVAPQVPLFKRAFEFVFGSKC